MKRQQQPQCPTCGEVLTVVDRHGCSETCRCDSCGRCYLYRACADVVIRLERFHRRRGPGNGYRPYDDHGMAQGLVATLKCNARPSPAKVVDFGIDTFRHLMALQYAVQKGITAYDLDRVIGDGAAITALVRSVPGQPCDSVVFRTAWDSIIVGERKEIGV